MHIKVTLPGREIQGNRNNTREDDIRLVIPVADPKRPVSMLLPLIAKRLQKFTPADRGEIRVMELRSGGFLLNNNDLISDVLSDGEHCEVVDSSMWITLHGNYQKCTKWLELERTNFVTSDRVSVTIGYHISNAVFVKFWKGQKCLRLDLFDDETLSSYKPDAKVTVMRKELDSDTWGEARFIMQGGRLTGVETAVKAATDSLPIIHAIAVKPGADHLEANGEVQVVQAESKPKSNKKVPAGKSTAPTFPPELLVPITDAQRAPATEVAAEGALPFKIVQDGCIFADQSRARSDGKWNQLFYTKFQLTNTHGQMYTVSKLEGEYFDGANWKPVDELCAGSCDGYYRYSINWRDPKPTIKLEDQGVLKNYVLCAVIKMPDGTPQNEVHRRAHHSFPNPMQLRFTFTGHDSKVSKITVQNVNPALDVKTEASRQEYRKGKMVVFASIDDFVLSERFCVEGWIEEDSYKNNARRMALQYSLNSSYNYFDCNHFRKLAFQGIEEGKDEVPLNEDWAEGGGKTKPFPAECYAMVDAEARYCYGLHVVLHSNGGKTDAYFPLPDLD